MTFVNDAVNIEQIVIPHKIQITEKRRAGTDLGDLSPYLVIIKKYDHRQKMMMNGIEKLR